jgi:hypothetical protein
MTEKITYERLAMDKDGKIMGIDKIKKCPICDRKIGQGLFKESHFDQNTVLVETESYWCFCGWEKKCTGAFVDTRSIPIDLEQTTINPF